MERIYREKWKNIGTSAPVELLCDKAFLDYAYKRQVFTGHDHTEGFLNILSKNVEYSFAKRSMVIFLSIDFVKDNPPNNVYAEFSYTLLDDKEEVNQVREKLEKILTTF